MSGYSGKGTPGLQTFIDSLQRTTGLGPNWQVGYQDFTQVSNQQLNQCQPTGNGLVLGTGATGGVNNNFPIIPLPLSPLFGLTQFAELQLVSSVGNSLMGPAVAYKGTPIDPTDSQNGYFAGFQVSLTRIDLFVSNIGVRAIQTNVCALAANDLIRLAVQFNTPAGGNSISVYRNGILQGTFVDNNALRPLTGMPAIFCQGFPINSTLTSKNFRGGPGLGV